MLFHKFGFVTVINVKLNDGQNSEINRLHRSLKVLSASIPYDSGHFRFFFILNTYREKSFKQTLFTKRYRRVILYCM